MAGAIRLGLGDQLSRSLSGLAGLDKERDVVLMAEVIEEVTYVRHHKRKVAFLFSAMRHFADELREEGITVEYVRLDDEANSGSFSGEVARAVTRHGAERLVLTESGEHRVLVAMRDWEDELGIDVEISNDDRFVCPPGIFESWAEVNEWYLVVYADAYEWVSCRMCRAWCYSPMAAISPASPMPPAAPISTACRTIAAAAPTRW